MNGQVLNADELTCKVLGYSLEIIKKFTIAHINPVFTVAMWKEAWAKNWWAGGIVVPHQTQVAKSGHYLPISVAAHKGTSCGMDCIRAYIQYKSIFKKQA